MGEAESRPLVVVWVNPYFASQSLDDESAYRQSDTGALVAFVSFLKTIEYRLALVGCNAASGVGNGKLRHIVLYAEREGDGAFLGELIGVN